jgi:hypothetical protein
MECPRLEQGGLDFCQPAVNRVNLVNLTFSDLRLPDWRGANYPQSIDAARGTQVPAGRSALLSRTDVNDGGHDVRKVPQGDLCIQNKPRLFDDLVALAT